MMKIAVLIVSDSCYSKEKTDGSGKLLLSLVGEFIPTTKNTIDCVPDDKEMIKEKLIEWTSNANPYDLVLTTGGTGFMPRDVTPEATLEIIEKRATGIETAMVTKGLCFTDKAMLSRSVCGIRNKSLIINFPGSEKAVKENFLIIKDVLIHAVAAIQNDSTKIQDDHSEMHNATKKTQTPSKVTSNPASRNRFSPYEVVTAANAHEIIFSVCPRTSETEVVNLKTSLGRVLGEDVYASDPLPPFRAAIKDGYAVVASDGTQCRTVMTVSKAGDAPLVEQLKQGHCVRISTGAPVPEGADAVVPVESTGVLEKSVGGEEQEIEFYSTVTAGQNIRNIGSDISQHTVILKKYSVLNPAEVGVLATIGKIHVKVFSRLSVGVLSTGNELQEPETKLQHGYIRDSNKLTLLCLLDQYGYSGRDYGIVKDNPNELKWRLEKAMSECDLIVTSGGVSMGECDYVDKVLQQDFNAKIHFGNINMKPGKPTKFASCLFENKMKYIFALPGNPVSATVTWLLFVLPALRYYENRKEVLFPMIRVKLDFKPDLDKERMEFHRVKLSYRDAFIRASSTGNQISSRLNSCVNADGLLILPALGKKYADYGYDDASQPSVTIKEEVKKTLNADDFYWCYKLDTM